ncbi:MAG: hypothetical protein HRU70_13740 [Phycisphaeraceae bacterium]|nr:MAG: hypothetical protein HRU70_13740 [Phycisphaeraceae bacterium]
MSQGHGKKKPGTPSGLDPACALPAGGPAGGGVGGVGGVGVPVVECEVKGVRRVVTLIKGGQRWRFVYARGEEESMIGAVRSILRRPKGGLDWVDVALVNHEIRRGLSDVRAKDGYGK